jgi:hypothetical protein
LGTVERSGVVGFAVGAAAGFPDRATTTNPATIATHATLAAINGPRRIEPARLASVTPYPREVSTSCVGICRFKLGMVRGSHDHPPTRCLGTISRG